MAKTVKFLIVPLATGDIKRLERCMLSLERLFPTDDLDIQIEFDIDIVVNTTNQEFVNEAKQTFYGKYPVTVTVSDGTPGTGKNSVFEFFRTKKRKYDYLFQIDGDDFLYPTALRQISKVLSQENCPDVISFQSMDWLSTNFTDKMSYAPIIDNKLWLYSWCDNEPNLREIPAFTYVTDENFGESGRIFTPGTSMILSRHILHNHRNIQHTNEIKLFEDYLFYLKLFNLHLNGLARMVHLNNSYIYVYDKANEDSVSTHNCFYTKDKEIRILKDYVKKHKMLKEKHPKDDLPFIKIQQPTYNNEVGEVPVFDLADKILFCKFMIEKFNVKLNSKRPPLPNNREMHANPAKQLWASPQK